jgi:hypothetical protein
MKGHAQLSFKLYFDNRRRRNLVLPPPDSRVPVFRSPSNNFCHESDAETNEANVRESGHKREVETQGVAPVL